MFKRKNKQKPIEEQKPKTKLEESTPKLEKSEPKEKISKDKQLKIKKSHKIAFAPKGKKLYLTLFISFVILLIGCSVFCYFYLEKIFSTYHPNDYSKLEEKTYIYDNLTGQIIEDEKINSMPINCIQIPNGTDGARSQAGLNQASIIFEAIAEAGITRFAAIFKNPTVSAIGPVRSLRIYYLQWDTPFDCTIVHAGGAPDALAALKSGGYRDHTENYTYMYRSAKNSTLNRRWNNLFTNPTGLTGFNQDHGYNTSNPKTFPRLTPFESEEQREELDAKIAAYTEYAANPDDYEKPIEPASLVTSIKFRFGNLKNFNPVYTYNKESNTYLRAYESGQAHTVYNCSQDLTGKITPEVSCGEPIQLAPSVVIAMIVQESKASDNYHEAITTIGSGKAYIFQNGTAIEGTWEKSSAAEQIVFRNSEGEIVSLAPGQTWISAIPNSGSVTYE